MSFAMTERHDRTSVGYNLARRGVEIIKQKGFNGPEYLAGAPLVIYYDLTGGGGSLTLVAGVSLYKVSITSIGDRADATALRTVIAIVTKLDTNTEVCRSGTYLVRSGL
jgi:hypothetical protein